MPTRTRSISITTALAALAAQAILMAPGGVDARAAAGMASTGLDATTGATSGLAPTDPRWGPITRLARHTQGQSMTVDGHGTITVVWANRSKGRSIMAVRRPAGRPWGTPQVIGRGHEPRVAADARGNVTAVWLTRRFGSADGVATARRHRNGPWSHPRRISATPQPTGRRVVDTGSLTLAVDGRGGSVAAWSWRGGGPRDIQAAYRPPGRSWEEPHDITHSRGTDGPVAGIDGDGGLVVVYGRQRPGHSPTLWARHRPAGSGWKHPLLLSRDATLPALGVDRAGNATVVYRTGPGRVASVRRPEEAGRWRRPQMLSPEDLEVERLDMAMNRRGGLVVTLAAGNGVVDLVRRPPTGPWSEPVQVSRSTWIASAVPVALNGSGDILVGWGLYAVLGRYRPHDGPWNHRVRLSPDSGSDVLEAACAVVTPGGAAAVLWDQEARPLKVRFMPAPRRSRRQRRPAPERHTT